MNKEVAKKLWELYLNNLETSTKIIDDLIPVVKTFDGKCYNRRFDNALNKVTEEKYNVRCFVSDFDYERFTMELGFYDYSLRSVKGDKDNNGYCTAFYLPKSYEQVTIASLYSDYNVWTTDRKTNSKFYSLSSENHFYIDDNYNTRIGSDKIISVMQEKKKYLTDKIKTLKEKFSNLDEYETKLKNIKAELKALSDDIPYELTDFFEIKIPSYY